MSKKNLFEHVKGLLGKPQQPEAVPMPRPVPRHTVGNYQPPPPKPADPDSQNPATILRVGKSTDGRELIMTQGYGTFLVDREAPTICYFDRGAVQMVPTLDLKGLIEALMTKRNVGEFAIHYVDLLNVATHEVEMRTQKRRGAVGSLVPAAPAPKPASRARGPVVPDAENPATITRVGRSANGADLIMTLGLGTFVVDRDHVSLRYFDRGREWDVPEPELAVLIDALMAKENMDEHRYAYIDLLNVATFVQQNRPAKRPQPRR